MLYFSHKIKELRAEKKISQNDLASELGVTRSTIAMYETDRIAPSPDMLLKIADFFDISLDELFGRKII